VPNEIHGIYLVFSNLMFLINFGQIYKLIWQISDGVLTIFSVCPKNGNSGVNRNPCHNNLTKKIFVERTLFVVLLLGVHDVHVVITYAYSLSVNVWTWQ
jgi:hypothetical protein